MQTPDTVLNNKNVIKLGETADRVIDRNKTALVVIAAGFLPNLKSFTDYHGVPTSQKKVNHAHRVLFYTTFSVLTTFNPCLASSQDI